MNIQVGKSAGIALLLAAALLAALFAMGVFAPAGLGANVLLGDKAPTAKLTGKGGAEIKTVRSANQIDATHDDYTGPYSLVVEFEVDDAVDGLGVNSAGNTVSIDDSVTITVAVPAAADNSWLTGIAASAPAADPAIPPIKISQGGDEVGTSTISTAVAAGEELTFDITSGIEKDERVTVTIPGVTVAASASGTITAKVEQSDGETEAMVRLVDTNEAPPTAEAKVDDDIDTTLIVTFTTNTASGTDDDISDVVIELPYSTSLGAVTVSPATATRTVSGKEITITGLAEGTDYTVNVFNLADLAAGDEVEISQANTGYVQTLTVGGGSQTTSAAVADDPTDSGVLSSTKAGAANVEITLMNLEIKTGAADTTPGFLQGGKSIVVDLPGFGIPAATEIDNDDIIIDGIGDNEFYGSPDSVSVSGSKITLRLPARMPGATPNTFTRDLLSADNTVSGDTTNQGLYHITFSGRVGISNPADRGTVEIKVDDGDKDSNNLAAPDKKTVAIVPHVSLMKPGTTKANAWYTRGDPVQVTAKGLKPGTATVHLLSKMDADEEYLPAAEQPVLGRGVVVAGENSAIIEIDTTSSIFKNGSMVVPVSGVDTVVGLNKVFVVDASGNAGFDDSGTDDTKIMTRLGLLPTVTLDVSDVKRSGKMTVTVTNWYYGDIQRVTVGGLGVLLPDGDDDGEEADPWKIQRVSGGRDENGGTHEFDVIVPRESRLGTQTVTLTGTTLRKAGKLNVVDSVSKTVDVGSFTLSVTPETAVTDQVVRIEGTGFLERSCITSIMVGEQAIKEATSGDDVGDDARDCVDTDSNGKLADSFHVPFGLAPGTYTLVIRDVGNRVGQTELTIPAPAIELDPTMGQRGDTVTVVGSNFPSEDLVTVSYRGIPVASGTTDTVGKWRATFTVPITAPIGAEHTVLAKSENKGDGSTVDGVKRATLTATAMHEVPDETLTLSPDTVSAGGRLTVVGGNLPLFTPVTVRIGGIIAAGHAIGEDDASDGTGRYERVILVPQLQPGTHTVELTAHARNEDISIARFVDVSDVVTRPTAEVFADLIADGILASVWRYQIDDTGSDWDSYDPQYADQPGINDLELVSTDDIVWIRVTENVADFQGAPLFAGWNLRTLE